MFKALFYISKMSYIYNVMYSFAENTALYWILGSMFLALDFTKICEDRRIQKRKTLNVSLFNTVAIVLFNQFAINLPSNVSIVDVMMVQEKGLNYLIPLVDIENIIDLEKYDVETTSNQRVFHMDKQLVLLETISDMLPTLEQPAPPESGEETKETSDKGYERAILVRVQDRYLAFDFEKIIGQRSVVISKLKGKLANSPGINGGAILSDGMAGLVLDLPFLATTYIKLKSGDSKNAA